MTLFAVTRIHLSTCLPRDGVISLGMSNNVLLRSSILFRSSDHYLLIPLPRGKLAWLMAASSTCPLLPTLVRSFFDRRVLIKVCDSIERIENARPILDQRKEASVDAIKRFLRANRFRPTIGSDSLSNFPASLFTFEPIQSPSRRKREDVENDLMAVPLLDRG